MAYAAAFQFQTPKIRYGCKTEVVTKLGSLIPRRTGFGFDLVCSSRPTLHSTTKFRHSGELDSATQAALNSPPKRYEPNATLVAEGLSLVRVR